MPELPEVETMVRDLQSRVTSRTIVGVETPFTGTIRFPDPSEFVQRLTGRRITCIWRRGKYAVFELDSGDALILHRGMTGSLLLRSPDAPREPHARLIFRLDDGSELRFDDPRKFGKAFLMHAAGEERPMPWVRMGPEPLTPDFTPEYLATVFRGRKAPVKPLLLNQEIVAGLGNIYVDESLFRAGIHPLRPAGSLSSDEIARLHGAIRGVLAHAVDGRGTTFSTYRDIEGRQGTYQATLSVFRKAGEPCPTCGTPIERTVVVGRGTHFCPECQRSPEL
jgi:formamidopyrimidine-DNA glycosylase